MDRLGGEALRAYRVGARHARERRVVIRARELVVLEGPPTSEEAEFLREELAELGLDRFLDVAIEGWQEVARELALGCSDEG